MAVEPDTFIEVAAALDLNTVRTATAQTTADTAQGTAAEAISRVYGAELGAKVYTDAEIQEIRDYIDAELTARINTLAAALGIDITGLVNGALPSLDAAILQALSDMGVIKNDALSDRNAVEDAITNWVNNLIPDLQTVLDQTVLGLNGVETTLGELTNGFTYTEIRAAVDDIRSKGEQDLVPLGLSTLRAPATLWGLNVDQANTNLVKATLGTYGTFVTDDVNFAECFYFADGDEQNVGAAFPIDYADGNMYKVTVELKALSDGSPASGVEVKVGATLQNGTTILSANQEQKFEPQYVKVADGVVRHHIFVSSDQVKLDDYGTVVDEQILLGSFPTANKIYFHVRQNAGGSTNGQLALGTLRVVDITEISVAVDRKYEVLRAETETSIAEIITDYITIAASDAALASATTTLQASIDGLDGEINAISSDITVNYVTNSSLTNSLASGSTVLNSRFSLVQGAADTAQATAVSANALAGDAVGYADIAQLAADVADGKAVTAQTLANNAQAQANVATANASTALTTATSAEGSIAALNTSLNSNFGGTGGSVNVFASTMTDLNNDVKSGYWLKATAGNSSAALSVYSANGVSAIELDADNVIVNGTIITDLIKGNQQISAMSVASGSRAGGIGMGSVCSTGITLPSESTGAYVMWFIDQGYSGDPQPYGINIAGLDRGATFGSDFCSGIRYLGSGAGYHSANLQWYGGSNMNCTGNIIVFGAKR